MCAGATAGRGYARHCRARRHGVAGGEEGRDDADGQRRRRLRLRVVGRGPGRGLAAGAGAAAAARERRRQPRGGEVMRVVPKVDRRFRATADDTRYPVLVPDLLRVVFLVFLAAQRAAAERGYERAVEIERVRGCRRELVRAAPR